VEYLTSLLAYQPIGTLWLLLQQAYLCFMLLVIENKTVATLAAAESAVASV